MHRFDVFSMAWPLEEENQGQGCDQYYAHEPEGVVKGDHGCLLYEATVYGAISRHFGHALCETQHMEKRFQFFHGNLVGHIKGSQVTHKGCLMKLSPPGKDCGYKGNPEATTKVPDKVEQRGGIPHPFPADD